MVAVLSVVERHPTTATPDELVGTAPEVMLELLKPSGSVRRVFAAVDGGHVVVFARDTSLPVARTWLSDVINAIAARRLTVDGQEVRLTPVAGVAEPGRDQSAHEVVLIARDAWVTALSRLDLQPVVGRPGRTVRINHPVVVSARRAVRVATSRLSRVLTGTPAQILTGFAVALVVPFLVYTAVAAVWRDITGPAYVIVVSGLVLSAVLIWSECLHAVAAPRTPRATAPPEPATAVIAAYLPNEAATIVGTVEHFQQIDYPAGLQIILAYNGPRRLPVEDTLEAMAAADPRLLLLRVDGSTSKAQNVNAAIGRVTGSFVGIFDADHYPAADSYTRAWRWISNGYDVVGGHVCSRNGANSFSARLVSIEFESIYAVSHTGRASVSGFGLFGGSNGFWRTDLLHRTRLRPTMLTEDIDSTIRALAAGARVTNDAELLSRDIAPETMKDLWNQRIRWAQGWFEVAWRRLGTALRAPTLSLRQKIGMVTLLVVPQVYPWLTLQVIPLVVFGLTHPHGSLIREWFAPVFLLTTLVTASSTVAQTVFAKRLGYPELTERSRSFWFFLIMTVVFYTEFKNTIARTAQIRHLLRKEDWIITPRSAQPAPADAPSAGVPA